MLSSESIVPPLTYVCANGAVPTLTLIFVVSTICVTSKKLPPLLNPDIVKFSIVLWPFNKNASLYLVSVVGVILTDLMLLPVTVTKSGTVSGNTST